MRANTIIAGMLLASTAIPAQVDTQEAAAQQPKRAYDLMVGDAAPSLAIAEWVKGEPVEAFAEDSVYVVEFWATWCGPCIYGMPHLSELQQEYADQGVTVVGVNIWDEPANVAPFLEKNIEMHGKTGDEVMQYTVAIETKDNPEDQRNGVMAKKWMHAAGRRGIPSAFIVDQNQRIAWIGHPSTIDTALAKVVAGEWDLAAETANYAMAVAGQAKVDKYNKLFHAGEYEVAYALGREIVRGPLAKNAAGLNQLAWGIVDPEHTPKVRDLDLALDAAKLASELTENKDVNILDTLALVYHERGNLTEAVKFQQLAVKNGGADTNEEIVARLAKFEKELKAQAAEASAKKNDK